ncbi:hypothetical protein G7046_g1313 [Stylonectria norvegica]|nr:hypothetical protein G7046_g1313 [Stylonectria norvegica]
MSSGALKYLNKLQGQRVLVIGGSTGIGYAVAENALEHGAEIILSSSNQNKVDKAIARLQQHVKAAGLPERHISGKACNLADPALIEDSVQNLLEFATKDGKLDHVVFTAGDALKIEGLEKVTVETIHQIAMVRVTGAIIVAKYLSKYINQSVRSSYTVTSGTMLWRPSPGWSVMAGAVGGIEGLARGLAIDMKPVRVNCVQPGAVHTELFDSIPKENLEQVLEVMRRDTITHTVGKPEDLAEVYLYFMKNTFSTATTVGADGGRLAGDSKGAAIAV